MQMAKRVNKTTGMTGTAPNWYVTNRIANGPKKQARCHHATAQDPVKFRVPGFGSNGVLLLDLRIGQGRAGCEHRVGPADHIYLECFNLF